MFLSYWQIYAGLVQRVLVLATHILRRVRNPNESDWTTSFTFYLESNVTKLSLLAFPRREILEELLGTPGRILGRILITKDREKV